MSAEEPHGRGRYSAIAQDYPQAFSEVLEHVRPAIDDQARETPDGPDPNSPLELMEHMLGGQPPQTPVRRQEGDIFLDAVRDSAQAMESHGVPRGERQDLLVAAIQEAGIAMVLRETSELEHTIAAFAGI